MWVLVARPMMVILGTIGAMTALSMAAVVVENPVGTGVLMTEVLGMMIIQLVGSLLLIAVGVSGPFRRWLGGRD